MDSHEYLNQLEDNHYDAILLLDCAYHLKNREALFDVAFTKLKEGGYLALTDFSQRQKPTNNWNAGTLKAIFSLCGIPGENLKSRELYQQYLEDVGYSSVDFEPIESHVFPGFIHFVEKSQVKKLLFSHFKPFMKFWLTAQFLKWAGHHERIQYSLISAQKKVLGNRSF